MRQIGPHTAMSNAGIPGGMSRREARVRTETACRWRRDNMSMVTRYPDGRRAIANTLTVENTTSLSTRTVELAQWLKHDVISSPPSDVTPQN